MAGAAAGLTRRGRRVRGALGASALAVAAGCGMLPPASAPLVVAPVPLDCRLLAHGTRGGGPTPLPIVGAEDATVHHAAGVAYVSAQDRRAPGGGTAVVGRVLRVDLRATPPVARDVTPEALATPAFRPHGLGLWPRGDGSARLFVVNHRSDGTEAVEVMDAAPGERGPEPLALGEPITGAALVSPNDVAAVGERQVYVTNDGGSPPGTVARTLRDAAGRNDGSVAYYDGARFSAVLPRLPWANGVAADPSTRRVHVASSSEGTVTTLAWEGDAHPAAPLGDPLPLGTRPDNVEVAPGGGGLLVAAHPSSWRFLLHRTSARFAAPTQVVAVPRAPDGTPGGPGRVPVEVLRLSGEADALGPGFPAASVAAAHRDPATGRERLLLGAVFAPGLLVCDLPPGSSLLGPAPAPPGEARPG